MLDSRDIGGLQGAPIHGPDNEKIGNVAQVFVDAVTGAPNWVTLKTGFLGRHEIFAPLANATWDGEVLRTDLDKDTLLAAPRLNADEGLSPHNEEALNRHFGLSEDDTDGGTARPSDEYPERPDLMEQAAARKREEESAAADDPTDGTRDRDGNDRTDTDRTDNDRTGRGADDNRTHDHDSDHHGAGDQDRDDRLATAHSGESAPQYVVERDIDGQAGTGQAGTGQAGSGQADSGPRHAKPTGAV
jgi:hypothetical protein